jgi:pimeloyl-ACP methyl ester carboxylesterase
MINDKPTLYLFSGLGVDERAFQSLDLSRYDTVLVRWIKPAKNETIADYALRLCEQITGKNPILIGISFGGMIAVEAAKHVTATKVIILASAKTRSEIPVRYRLAGKIGLPQIVPAPWIKHPNRLTYRFFGASLPAEKTLLKQILDDTDPVFLKWALTAITGWKNDAVPENLTHIHGTRDRTLPFRRIVKPIPVKGGGHFMTISRANEISALLAEVLQPSDAV